MKHKRIRAKCNFICTLCGIIDKIFKKVQIDKNGNAMSGFISGRKQVFTQNSAVIIDEAQSELNYFRTVSDQQIAQFDKSDVELLNSSELKTPMERRRLLKITESVNILFEVNNAVKKGHVRLHSALDVETEKLRRQITAYLIAAVPKNQRGNLNIERNLVSFENSVAYETYFVTYRYVDVSITKFVDDVLEYDQKLKRLEEVINHEDL